MKAYQRKVLNELIKKPHVPRKIREAKATLRTQSLRLAASAAAAVMRDLPAEPKARWCPRVSKERRKAHARIIEKARQLRAELQLPPSPELERPR